MFTRAVDSLLAVIPRPDLTLEQVRAPRRLAPWAFALGATVYARDEEAATGRLVLLYDESARGVWDGTLRLVSFTSASLDAEMARDPLLAEVGWSWLRDALAEHRAGVTAAVGTVTLTSSTRFGDMPGPRTSVELELRASWTPTDADLGAHLRAWMDLLCTSAGLPPPGVTLL